MIETASLLLAIPFIAAFILYIYAAISSGQRFNKWPAYRIALWMLGTIFALLSVAGPLAKRAHMDFEAHMLGHLFLGMLAPLLMALAKPMTLALRALSVKYAKKLARILRSRPIIFLSNPLTATILNVGGLWVLYTTDLYMMMHQYLWLHLLVHMHVFLAGYIFTISLIYLEPTPHRYSYLYRSIILVIALAGHGILSKFIYANPPAGVPPDEARAGGMLMYYGGDAIDIVLVFLLCLHWFRASKPQTTISQAT
ncbi:cytochrome c oxidase assembly protein [Thalassobacillus pellis]|uniref:cytochrome c oxidase assembly protein n=1 Tax=Thalassobacillus pellis TaxID=748008 RepID=UPI00195F389C|nr:cytochrome c oxidase assembly protein [Thalassobacillus pellis]